jgi:hypothetical protein
VNAARASRQCGGKRGRLKVGPSNYQRAALLAHIDELRFGVDIPFDRRSMDNEDQRLVRAVLLDNINKLLERPLRDCRSWARAPQLGPNFSGVDVVPSRYARPACVLVLHVPLIFVSERFCTVWTPGEVQLSDSGTALRS